MVKNVVRLALAAWFGLALVITQQPASAVGGAIFTLSVKSTFLRAQPGFAASPAFSAFKGQTYALVGRTADNSWFQLDFAGASNGAPWVFSSYGSVTGDLTQVPVTGDTVAAASAPTPAPATGTCNSPLPGPRRLRLRIAGRRSASIGPADRRRRRARAARRRAAAGQRRRRVQHGST